MLRLNLRAVQILPSMDSCTVAHVQILQIGKVHFIKTADLLEHRSPVDGVPAQAENTRAGFV